MKLTREVLEEAARRIKNDYGRPRVEYHHPRCRKLQSTTEMLACSCGAEPLDAVFEAALKK